MAGRLTIGEHARLKARIKELHNRGMRAADIASEANCAENTSRAMIKEMEIENKSEDTPFIDRDSLLKEIKNTQVRINELMGSKSKNPSHLLISSLVAREEKLLSALARHPSQGHSSESYPSGREGLEAIGIPSFELDRISNEIADLIEKYA